MLRHVPPLSRQGLSWACVLMLGTATGAWAQDALPPPPPTVDAAPTPERTPALPMLGISLDAGVPDGVGVSAVVRPLPWLRVHGGVTSNTLSLGLRAGASWVPLTTLVSPSLNVDVGHYFSAKYNKLVDRLGSNPLQTDAPINDVGYDYASAAVGVEVGSPQRFAAFLRIGLSYSTLKIDDAQALLQDVADDPDITATPLSLRFTSPAVKLGFLLYFF
ncbi:autotransporter outer membrane beta-barrel domain-containing protein [Stigmatella sp. ncwal1]|uniref:Autotransporter outer membrane beta-barrel domain-containing protein n=1 Tax=Stigmatella ashevillensis TaxID=2995309 RepID=A0ABT5DLK4_9BACT|nr:autotransporter outer membrane beta-barrel domain-containing protein [Stigmatella ashevillena]MDC0713236.1 autotransporter outer membrane beta-barrel domain-containing protein [Stigmatella ashevillena]